MAQSKSEKSQYNKIWRQANAEHVRASMREWRANNRERTRAYNKQHRLDNPDYYKNRRRNQYVEATPEQKQKTLIKNLERLRAKVGWYPGLFDSTLVEQNGLCAICRISPGTDADHNHQTNKARGVLCGRCNAGLGFFVENPTSLENAIDYLRKWSE